ncbi:hypothetical protein C1645_492184 [Glomus cerebriforme]|uniref:Uncharacterized protein n=1 Tax=Glomus cerebriforme TaxID=658196 RepID=A0A397SJQ8_9GLOM|nr:hypothetical protein C1645_492184 [Glomus cerebriforme]
MNNNGKEIELNLDIFEFITNYYCTFNLKGDFILYNKVDNKYNKFDTRHDIIRVYNTQTKNNKWTCKSIYKIPEGFEFISISKYDKLYLLFSHGHCIYECNLRTEESLKIFSKEAFIESKEVKVSSNEKFIHLIFKNKIIIYSIELKFPIITLEKNNGKLKSIIVLCLSEDY